MHSSHQLYMEELVQDVEPLGNNMFNRAHTQTHTEKKTRCHQNHKPLLLRSTQGRDLPGKVLLLGSAVSQRWALILDCSCSTTTSLPFSASQNPEHEARTYKFVGFLTFHFTQLGLNRCLMGWMAAELRWKHEELLGASRPGLDIDHELAMFNFLQAAAGFISIPAFGWLVARFGHRRAPFCATAGLAVLFLAIRPFSEPLLGSTIPGKILYLETVEARQYASVLHLIEWGR